MKEEWRDVVGFKKYKVSNLGRVKSFHKHKDGFIMSQSDDKDGYKKLSLTKEGKEYTRRVHILVAQSFIDNPEQYPVINHIDGIKYNNNVSNLEWTTVKANTIHGLENGFNPNIGESHPHAQKYKVYMSSGKLIARYTNTHEIERCLGISRGSINKLITNNKLLYDELIIKKVDKFSDYDFINIEIGIDHSLAKSVLNPIKLTDINTNEYEVYASLSECARLNGFSREGVRDRLKDGRVYKRQYLVTKVTQFDFLQYKYNQL